MAGPGDLIGPYRLLSQLGAGAMGEVWRARDERLDRYVAVKLLPPDLAADPERRARMLREAKASAAVPHANVVTLYDIFSEHDRDYLVMELVEGQTLSERLRAGGIPPLRKALDWVIAVSDALEAAHSRGILHRDIKSANVMISDDGAVKVLDFGLAKLREAQAPIAPAAEVTASPTDRPTATKETLVALDATMPSAVSAAATGDYLQTRAGSLMGTPMYMAPEQVRGEAPDEQSEVFAAGVIAYELFTGEVPYKAATLDDLFHEIEHGPVPALRSDAPRPVAEIVARSLAKDRADRFASMAELRDAAIAVRDELFAPPKPKRWPFAAAAGALAAIVAGVIVYATAGGTSAPPPERPGDKYVRQAQEQYDVFDNKKAHGLLRSAVKNDPDHPRAYAYMILFGYAKDDEEADALAEARRILPTLDEDHKKERALLGAAINLVTRGPRAAREALLAAGAKEDRELAFWSAELAFRARDYETAEEGFRELLAADDPAFRGRIYDHQSAVLLFFGKAEEALEVGRMYAEAFPGEADAIGVYATTLAAAGHFDEALDRAQEALDLYEGEDTLAGLAKVHAYRGELDEAKRYYEESMQRAGDNRRPVRRAALGLLHFKDGEIDQAREVVAPCLPGGEDAAIETRGACLWVAGLVDPETIPVAIAELEKLAEAGTELDPPYGFPANLARLLKARALYFGGGCVVDVDPPELDGPTADRVRALLEDSRDFYAAYHVPFFNDYAGCELDSLP